MLTAKIIEADPQAAEERAKIWEAERFVRAGRTGQSGLNSSSQSRRWVGGGEDRRVQQPAEL